MSSKLVLNPTYWSKGMPGCCGMGVIARLQATYVHPNSASTYISTWRSTPKAERIRVMGKWYNGSYSICHVLSQQCRKPPTKIM